MTAAPRGPLHLRAMRHGNLGSVLRALAERPGSRADLAQRTGLTKSTVASLVEPLIANDVLAEDTAEIMGRGRPARPLRFHPDGPVAIGVEINVGYLAATTLTLDGQAERIRRHDVDNRDRSAGDVVGELAALVRSLADEARRTVLGVGVAVPGIVHDSRVVRAPNLPRLVGCALGVQLADEIGIPDVQVDNEANLAAEAHLWPVRTVGPHFVYVSGEVGVGSGVVMNGELYRGTTGFAGEFGHVVIERAGRLCSCGGRGCVEQYAGLTAILRAAGRRQVAGLRRALDEGDPAAEDAVRQAGGALGVALSSLLNVCDIPVVVFGGIYAGLFHHLRPVVEAEVERRVLAAIQRRTEFYASTLGDEAAVRGAAGAVVRRACAEPDRLLALVRAGG